MTTWWKKSLWLLCTILKIIDLRSGTMSGWESKKYFLALKSRARPSCLKKAVTGLMSTLTWLEWCSSCTDCKLVSLSWWTMKMNRSPRPSNFTSKDSRLIRASIRMMMTWTKLRSSNSWLVRMIKTSSSGFLSSLKNRWRKVLLG